MVGYSCNCSFDPPMVMVGIVPSRFSYKLVKDTGCFVINLATKDQKEIFDYLGSHSGWDEDKFASIGIMTAEAQKIDAPLLSDCPVNIECRVVDSIVTGSHEMFVGQIEAVLAEERYIDKDGNIDFSELEII